MDQPKKVDHNGDDPSSWSSDKLTVVQERLSTSAVNIVEGESMDTSDCRVHSTGVKGGFLGLLSSKDP